MVQGLSMAQWEHSKMDAAEDKKAKGRYGKEGSKTEQAHDRKKLKEYNAKLAKKGGK